MTVMTPPPHTHTHSPSPIKSFGDIFWEKKLNRIEIGGRGSEILGYKICIMDVKVHGWTARHFCTTSEIGKLQNYYNYIHIFTIILGCLGQPQKNHFFCGPATKRGESKGLATKKKYFFEARKKKSGKNFVATKLEVGG